MSHAGRARGWFEGRKPTRLLAVAVVAVVVAGLSFVVAQWLQPPPLSDVERLAAHPEASLHYPGSVPLYDGGSETTTEATAQRWQLRGTSATREEILAFYVGELTARGYVNGGPIDPTTEQTMACSWSRDLVVRIGFYDPVAIRRRFKIDPNYATVYDLRIIDRTGNTLPRPCSSLTECEPYAAPGSSAGASPQVRCRILD
jgi:hypothetical protein